MAIFGAKSGWGAFVLLVAVSGAFATPVASAQSPEDAARGRFQEGVAAAREGRWQQAHDAFSEAHEALGRPTILINLANARVQLGRLVEGARTYERFLAEVEPGSSAAEHRGAVEDALEQVRQRIPRLSITLEGAGAGDEVRVDGETVARDALGSVGIDPGSHEVELVRDGTVLSRASAEVEEGGSAEVRLEAPAPESAELAASSEEPALTDGEDEGSVLASPWLWVGVGAAVVAGALAVILVATAGGEPDPITGNVGPGFVGIE